MSVPGVVGKLISILGQGGYPLSVFCPVLSATVLTTHSWRPALMYLTSVLVHTLLLLLQAFDPRAVSASYIRGGYITANETKGISLYRTRLSDEM